MSSKSKSFGKILLIVFVVALGIVALIFAIIHMAYSQTPDKDRTTNETDINVTVETLKDSPKAITKTFHTEQFSSFSESKQMKIRSSTCGKVEGDVPFVSIKNKKDSYVKISFKDKDSKNLVPEIQKIDLYTADGMPVSPKKRQDIGVAYDFDHKAGNLSMYLSDFIPRDKLTFQAEEEETGSDNPEDTGDSIWFCIFEIEYSLEGKNYVSITAVSVGK
ncbi:MAG: hypothetical protein HXL98_06570 [[Eubacterium] sulci]|nr:hypothetical protein [[Eubacterium] sulci]